MNNRQLYLKPEEIKFLGMAVVKMLEDLNESASDQTINWNPSARKDLKDMIAAGCSLKIKMGKLGFDVRDLPPYYESDNDDFLTKQS